MALEGDAVGCMLIVGMALGRAVDGYDVGIEEVGLAVGPDVGTDVGDTEGDTLGRLVGVDVGIAVVGYDVGCR